jgi:predicted TIM-barrel fold metal-dependent hydrolase
MIIDVHTHAIPGWTEEESVRKTFETTGIDRAFLLAMGLDHYRGDNNENCARMLELFPDRLHGFIGIHPPDIEGSLRSLDTYCRKGFIGVKLMPTSGYYPDDERYRRVFEEINARKLIVLSHCGWCSKGRDPKHDLPQNTLYSHPYHFEPLIRIFQDTDFIFAHGGGRTHYQAAFELVRYHDNAWVDFTPGQGTWILKFAPPEWIEVLDWSRALFGTDTAFGCAETDAMFHNRLNVVKEAMAKQGLTDKMDSLLHGNAETLLRKHGISI